MSRVLKTKERKDMRASQLAVRQRKEFHFANLRDDYNVWVRANQYKHFLVYFLNTFCLLNDDLNYFGNSACLDFT